MEGFTCSKSCWYFFLKIAHFHALFRTFWQGNNRKLNISLKDVKDGLSSELADGFVCLLYKEVPCQFSKEMNACQ